MGTSELPGCGWRRVLVGGLVVGAGSVSLAASHARGAEYLFEIDPSKSLSVFSQTFVTPLAGTLIGNYDAKTNPGGTLTRLGLFGGSGNMPIPYTGTISISAGAESSPQGRFRLDWTKGDETAEIRDLEIDVLGKSTGVVEQTFTINYATFRTINPSGFFPGGFPIAIPLGEAVLERLEIRQTKPALLVILPAGGAVAFSGAIPVESYAVATQGDQVFEIGPTPGLLPFSGTLVPTRTGYRLTADSESSDSFSETFEQELPPTPLPLPTLNGETANLILNGTITGANGTSESDLSIVADGVEKSGPSVPGDLDGNGVVDGADLAILLTDWGQSGVPADLNGDGIVDGGDLAVLLSNWSPA
jgi:hypothetical protein